jgi:hypothetical protein
LGGLCAHRFGGFMGVYGVFNKGLMGV